MATSWPTMAKSITSTSEIFKERISHVMVISSVLNLAKERKGRRHRRFPSWPNLRPPQAAGAMMTEPHAPIAGKRWCLESSRTGENQVNLSALFAVAPTKILVGALLPLPSMVTITLPRLSLSGASAMKPSNPLSLAARSSLFITGSLHPLRDFLAQNHFWPPQSGKFSMCWHAITANNRVNTDRQKRRSFATPLLPAGYAKR